MFHCEILLETLRAETRIVTLLVDFIRVIDDVGTSTSLVQCTMIMISVFSYFLLKMPIFLSIIKATVTKHSACAGSENF